jgi:hypothetical protein
VGSLPFVESFILKAFQENLCMIVSLPMLVDLQATFAMILFGYV